MMSFNKRRKANRLTSAEADAIDYKDITTLKNFVTETHKIVPSRVTGTKARHQRELASAIKRARYLALLPYTDSHK